MLDISVQIQIKVDKTLIYGSLRSQKNKRMWFRFSGFALKTEQPSSLFSSAASHKALFEALFEALLPVSKRNCTAILCISLGDAKRA
jgi:hypothetical protein